MWCGTPSSASCPTTTSSASATTTGRASGGGSRETRRCVRHGVSTNHSRCSEDKRFPVFQTFDECVSSGGSDCAPEKLWLQIPFFCGHHAECWWVCCSPTSSEKSTFFLPAGVTLYRNVGSKWALEQAKYNLLNEFLLVGVTEELEDFIMILEAALPHFFRGATELYRTGRVQANLMRRREG